jgi:TusA-related sulfurtransferase
MALFKTLDIRGHSFFNAFQMTSKAFKNIKKNGTLEIILDRKKDFTDALKAWAKSKGHTFSDMDGDHRMVRLFIRKNSA